MTRDVLSCLYTIIPNTFRCPKSISYENLYDILFFFFFSSRRRHTRFDCDWSSDVCSSDLQVDIDILQWGSDERSIKVLTARAKHRTPRRMLLALVNKKKSSQLAEREL